MNLFSMFEDSSSSSFGGSVESLDDGNDHSRFRCSGEGSILSRRSGGQRNRRFEEQEEITSSSYENGAAIKLSIFRKVVWRLVLLIMSLFFFAAAYVQHNDPDPYLWMPVYVVPFCVNVSLIISIPHGNWSFLNKLVTCHLAYCYTLGFWTLVCFAYGQVTSTSSSRFAEANMFAEEAKELLGICLVIAWLSFVNKGNFLRFGRKGVLCGVGLTALPIIAWVFLEELEGDRETGVKCL